MTESSFGALSGTLKRRDFLRAGAGVALGATLPLGIVNSFTKGTIRGPDSLPNPSLPAGEATDAFPFDHLIVVMMENHSFDNYFGMLPRHGKAATDGFKINRKGRPLNHNPFDGGFVRVTHATSRCQPVDVTQAWNPTHIQIDGGKMDGFAKTDQGSMLYWDKPDIPFYYSLGKTFTLANRWFCSAPCQTFPNRRFLLAATAYGLISTDTTSVLDPPPANGTIFDRLNAHAISWTNYFTDLPGTGVIASIPENNPTHLAPIAQFFTDCAIGNLPSVSFVDPEFGVTNDVGAALEQIPLPGISGPTNQIETQGGDEENPQDISLGENFVSKVVNAVMQSPAWPRTLLVWTYDEHGGYYDHVPPPAAIPPDDIKPNLGPGDIPGGYDIYGPRVPTVVVSPHSRRCGVTNVVHDHTSILATIEHKWNLPACTRRDANANTLADFIDPSRAPFAEPPTLAAPGDLASSETTCSDADPTLKVHHHKKQGQRKHHARVKRRTAA